MMKAADFGWLSPPFWLALVACGISVVVWIVGLSRLPVSQAYPVLSRSA